MEIQYKNPAIHKAFAVLKELSEDEEFLRMVEIRKKALQDGMAELSETREKGHQEGRQEAKKETALKLLAMNILTLEQIAEVTELSVEEVRNLENVVYR